MDGSLGASAHVEVWPDAFEPLAGRLTALELDVGGASLAGAAEGVGDHLAGTLRRLDIKVGGCACGSPA